MSYDFLIFKPRVPIRSRYELFENTVEPQNHRVVMSVLSSLLPTLSWIQNESNGIWEAQIEEDGAWYEFHVRTGNDDTWWIKTSHHLTHRPLIQKVCQVLGVIAYDGQSMTIIDENGTRPA